MEYLLNMSFNFSIFMWSMTMKIIETTFWSFDPIIISKTSILLIEHNFSRVYFYFQIDVSCQRGIIFFTPSKTNLSPWALKNKERRKKLWEWESSKRQFPSILEALLLLDSRIKNVPVIFFFRKILLLKIVYNIWSFQI